MPKRCPKCGNDTFIATAHVTEDWVLDGNGDFIAVSTSCVETTHHPDDDDIWECEKCGYEDVGAAFNVEAPNTSLKNYYIPFMATGSVTVQARDKDEAYKTARGCLMEDIDWGDPEPAGDVMEVDD